MYGGRHSNVPSRFLAEIPQELISKIAPKLSLDWQDRYVRRETVWRKKVEPVVERRIVADEEIEKETVKDFEEIDSW